MSLKTLVGSGFGIKKNKFGSGINHSGSATLLFREGGVNSEADIVIFPNVVIYCIDTYICRAQW